MSYEYNPVVLLKADEENSGSSREQARIVEAEIEKQQQLTDIETGLDQLQEVQAATKSSGEVKASNIADMKVGGNEDTLSVSSFISLINRGADELQITAFLGSELTSVAATLSKDRALATKQLKNLMETMVVLERSLAHSQQNPELQVSLKQMQGKLVAMVKTGNVETVQNFLKSSELKSALQKSANITAKQPENLLEIADHLKTSSKEAQKNSSQQKQSEKLQGRDLKAAEAQQKPELKAEKTLEAKGMMEKMLNKLAERGRDVKDALGISSKQTQLQPKEEALRSQPKPINTQQLLQSSQNSKVVPIREVGKEAQTSYAEKQPVQKTAQVISIKEAVNIKPEVKTNERPDVKLAAVAEKPTPSLSVVKPETKAVEGKQSADKPPTNAKPKAVGSCGENCQCDKLKDTKTMKNPEIAKNPEPVKTPEQRAEAAKIEQIVEKKLSTEDRANLDQKMVESSASVKELATQHKSELSSLAAGL